MAYTIYDKNDIPVAGDRFLEPVEKMCGLIEGAYILKDETGEKVYPHLED